MSLHYDLHCHSLASDGTLTPASLVRLAHAAGVQVLALTDHDTTDGIQEATDCAGTLGLQLIAGVEISVTWQSLTLHILGLNVDPECIFLQDGLRRLRDTRERRAAEIARRLDKAGIPDSYVGASALARGRIISRTHFARYLVEQGCAVSLRDVYRHYLVQGKPGYVRGEWAALEEALGWIAAAGGLAVIAHPARYRLSASKLRRLISEFREGGGAGMEVVSGSHTRHNVAAMAGFARTGGLLASRGSDYHGPENPWVKLGQLMELPAGCRPIWDSEHWPMH